MKIFNKLLFTLLLVVMNIVVVRADGDNLVNIYLFHSDTCPHCRDEIRFLNDIKDDYDNVKIYMYEISNQNNAKLLLDVADIYDTEVIGTPFTVIGDKYFKGFSRENYGDRFIAAIKYYSENSYNDRTGKYINDNYVNDDDLIEVPNYEENVVNDNNINVDTYIDESTDRKIKVFGREISLKKMTLPVISIVMGLVDGFNPCAMWVLLFLISMLIGMKDRKRMFVIGFTFLMTSALVYLLFMIAWLNAARLLMTINWFRLVIGLTSIVGAIINISGYVKHRKDNGCDVIDDKKRNKIFDRIKKFTHDESFILAIVGAMTLAISVNIIELACSAGIPVMFTEILSMNNLWLIEKIVYIGLYMIFFLLDDLIVFIIAMRTMELTGFSSKYGKVSKLVGGLLLLVIGVLLIFRPEWLMFNF